MKRSLPALVLTACLLSHPVRAQVVINEFLYDDTGADDREFVELYNSGTQLVDISGWVLGGYDATSINLSTTLPAGAVISAGGFYVIGNTGTLNVNHIVAANFLENDTEVITLRNANGNVVDAVAYEANAGISFVIDGGGFLDGAAVAAQVGRGIWGNHQGLDIIGTPLNATVSLGRFVDGRDTNNNGRDFGLRPATPGTSNFPGGTLMPFIPADPSALAPGARATTFATTFQPVRVIDPALADINNNPNVIAPPNGPGSKAWVMWDPSGGGDGAASTGVFPDRAAGFAIRAYFDTAVLPVQQNSVGTMFTGSEITLYGLGGGDALSNLIDISGAVTLAMSSVSANGSTGILWVYERAGVGPFGSPSSVKLYLVDARDGGDSNLHGPSGLYWNILASYDLSTVPPGWHDLAIVIDAAGNGRAWFDGRITLFTATDMHSSAFTVGYRENLQLGSDGTPDAQLRPATFAPIPLGPLRLASLTPTVATLTIPAYFGQSVGVQYSTGLGAGSWHDIGTFTVSGGMTTFSHVDPDVGHLIVAKGFYRAFLR